MSAPFTMRALCACAALTAVALLAVACGGAQAQQGPLYIDPDGDMGTANGLFYDMPPVDDRLNAQGGDAEDWRYIIVPRSGRISLTLNVDDPTMQGNWYLHDQQGRIIHSEAFDAARGFYELPEMPVTPGTYHFQINAAKGGSVYTVGLAYNPDPEPEPIPEPTAAAEPEEEEEEEEEPRRPRKPREKKPKKPKKPKAEPEDAGDEVTGTTKVEGSITLATELDDGSVEIVIRGVGKANGVTSGMKGKVKGLGLTVKTTSCSNRKCDAVVKGTTARDLRANGKVEFMVQ